MKKRHYFFTLFFASILLFTGCKKEDFVVTFHPNGGRGTAVSQPFTQKTAQPLMANPFTHRGYIFAGWNTAPDGVGVSYKDQENVMISANMVLYAQWASAGDEFTITFHANGGGTGNMEQQIFEAGIPQPLIPNAFIYDGYRFSCWCTTPNGDGQKFENQQNITVSSNMMLYAQWVPISNTYFVHFHPNGGMETIYSQSFIGGVLQPLDTCTFTRHEHIFVNWNTAEDGTGASYYDNESIKIYSNMLLYAQWEEE
jgi:uncharacterized repeat protein (TIGR02543 family)